MTGPSRSSVAVPRSTAVSTQQLRITLAGREHVVEAGTTAGAALAEAGLGEQQPGGHAVIAARINGQLRDLFCPVADGDVVEPVEIGEPDGRAILRHATAPFRPRPVQAPTPAAKRALAPPVENGFYYDFDVDQPFEP